jgi:hypothetical protein
VISVIYNNRLIGHVSTDTLNRCVGTKWGCHLTIHGLAPPLSEVETPSYIPRSIGTVIVSFEICYNGPVACGSVARVVVKKLRGLIRVPGFEPEPDALPELEARQ